MALRGANYNESWLEKSDGTLLTDADIVGNNEADRHAKLAAAEHRVNPRELKDKKVYDEAIRQRAMWIARATATANNETHFPFQDSMAALWRSTESKAQRRKAKLVRAGPASVIKKPLKMPIPASNGGHNFVPTHKKGVRSGWLCTICRISTSNARIASTRLCLGRPSKQMQGEEHTIVQSGTVFWCYRCGAYAESKTRALGTNCKGPPAKHPKGGGRWGQLQKLIKGRHPKTGLPLEPIETAGVSVDRRGSGTYSTLDRAVKETQSIEEGFRPYVPVPPVPGKVKSGVPASVLMAQRLDRIRARESQQLKEAPSGARSAG